MTAKKLSPAKLALLRDAAAPDRKVWQGTIDRRWYVTDLDGANRKVVTATVNALVEQSLLLKDKTRAPYRACLTKAGRIALEDAQLADMLHRHGYAPGQGK